MKTTMKRVLPGILVILVLCSHDMFLKMDGFFIEPNTDALIKLFNGTFEQSENVITRDRMLDVSLVGNGNRTKVDTAQWYEQDSITYLKFNSGNEGTWVAGVSTAPRNIEMDGEAFNNYLVHDGVLDMLEWRTENDLLDQPAVERYSKHVKIIFQVGESLSEDWNTVLGYPIEFVPLENPYDIHPGHELQVKLLLDGKPLSNQLVYVGNDVSGEGHSHEDNAEHTHEDGTTHSHDEEPEVHTHEDGTTHSHEEEPEVHTHEDGTTHSHDDAEDSAADHEHTGIAQLRTDENGIVSVNLTSTGVWYLRTIHMVNLEEEGLTHESNWATITFAIGDGHAHEHAEEAHVHEEEGIPSYVFWVGSIILVGLLFFWFNRKK